MMRFPALEGLRGWLAWMVVLCHIAFCADVYAKGWGPIIERGGTVAVMVFMIMSGFVITHLISERHEPYRIYIFRRFMRLFPLFAVTCVVGFFATPLILTAASRVPYRDARDFVIY